jgi:hypothetical protein
MKPPQITPYDRSVLMAVRALFDGKANEGQQKRAMEWICMNLCHIGMLSFEAESERASSFNEGMRFVGLQLAKMREPEALKLLEAWERTPEKKPVTRRET